MTQKCNLCGEILPDGVEYGIAHLKEKHKEMKIEGYGIEAT